MYHLDKPIATIQEDQLGRAEFAKQLADSILSIEAPECFAIGLYGKWGSGKTSVLNIMQNEIEANALNEDGSHRAIVMRFEPWNYSSCDQLLTQFFTQMATIVSADSSNKQLQKVGGTLELYSSAFSLLALIPKVGPFLSVIPNLTKALGEKIKKDADKRSNNLAERKQAVIMEKQL